MNTKITKIPVSLTQKQITMLAGLARSEAQRMRNRVPLEERTPLFQEWLDELDWVIHVLARAVRFQ